MPGLTKRLIEAARQRSRVTNSEIILRDGLLPGFGLRIQPPSPRYPGGKTTFFLRYRVPGGAQRRQEIAEWTKDAGEGQIKKARTVAEKWRVAIKDGVDPAEQKRIERAKRERAAGDTVSKIGEDFIRQHAAHRRWRELERVMRADIMPVWGKRAVSEVARRDVMDLLDRIAARAPVQANRTLTVLSIFFGWCAYRDIIPADPTARVKKPTREAPRERVLSDVELRVFWKGCDRLDWPFGPMLKLLALTAQRRGEIAELRWDEVTEAEKQIMLSGTRYKTGRPHIVPLSDTALAIVQDLPTRDSKSGFVFTTNDKTAVSGFSKAKAKLDGYMLEELRRDAPKPEKVNLNPWIIHDLRRTARTNFTRLGISGDIGERILGHVIPGIRGVYDRYEFLPEKRAALERWAAALERIVNPPLAEAKVVALRPGA